MSGAEALPSPGSMTAGGPSAARFTSSASGSSSPPARSSRSYLRHRRSVDERDSPPASARSRVGPVVLVKPGAPGTGARHLSLPGEARPFLSTTVYAKLPGYLRDIRTDKGRRVTAGQVARRSSGRRRTTRTCAPPRPTWRCVRSWRARADSLAAGRRLVAAGPRDRRRAAAQRRRRCCSARATSRAIR